MLKVAFYISLCLIQAQTSSTMLITEKPVLILLRKFHLFSKLSRICLTVSAVAPDILNASSLSFIGTFPQIVTPKTPIR